MYLTVSLVAVCNVLRYCAYVTSVDVVIALCIEFVLVVSLYHDGHSNKNVKNWRQMYSEAHLTSLDKFHQVGRHGLWPSLLNPLVIWQTYTFVEVKYSSVENYFVVPWQLLPTVYSINCMFSYILLIFLSGVGDEFSDGCEFYCLCFITARCYAERNIAMACCLSICLWRWGILVIYDMVISAPLKSSDMLALYK